MPFNFVGQRGANKPQQSSTDVFRGRLSRLGVLFANQFCCVPILAYLRTYTQGVYCEVMLLTWCERINHYHQC